MNSNQIEEVGLSDNCSEFWDELPFASSSNEILEEYNEAMQFLEDPAFLEVKGTSQNSFKSFIDSIKCEMCELKTLVSEVTQAMAESLQVDLSNPVLQPDATSRIETAEQEDHCTGVCTKLNKEYGIAEQIFLEDCETASSDDRTSEVSSDFSEDGLRNLLTFGRQNNEDDKYTIDCILKHYMRLQEELKLHDGVEELGLCVQDCVGETYQAHFDAAYALHDAQGVNQDETSSEYYSVASIKLDDEEASASSLKDSNCFHATTTEPKTGNMSVEASSAFEENSMETEAQKLALKKSSSSLGSGEEMSLQQCSCAPYDMQHINYATDENMLVDALVNKKQQLVSSFNELSEEQLMWNEDPCLFSTPSDFIAKAQLKTSKVTDDGLVIECAASKAQLVDDSGKSTKKKKWGRLSSFIASIQSVWKKSLRSSRASASKAELTSETMATAQSLEVYQSWPETFFCKETPTSTAGPPCNSFDENPSSSVENSIKPFLDTFETGAAVAFPDTQEALTSSHSNRTCPTTFNSTQVAMLLFLQKMELSIKSQKRQAFEKLVAWTTTDKTDALAGLLIHRNRSSNTLKDEEAQQAILKRKLEYGCIQIQRTFRKWQQRRKVQQRLYQLQLTDKEFKLVVKLQAVVRGMQTRKRIAIARQSCNGLVITFKALQVIDTHPYNIESPDDLLQGLLHVGMPVSWESSNIAKRRSTVSATDVINASHELGMTICGDVATLQKLTNTPSTQNGPQEHITPDSVLSHKYEASEVKGAFMKSRYNHSHDFRETLETNRNSIDTKLWHVPSLVFSAARRNFQRSSKKHTELQRSNSTDNASKRFAFDKSSTQRLTKTMPHPSNSQQAIAKWRERAAALTHLNLDSNATNNS